MAGNENQKLKTLMVLQILTEKTDKDNVLTADKIVAELLKRQIKAERKSIYSDVQALIDAGYKIEKSTSPKGYYLKERVFSLAELKILVDAVQSSHFVTEKKSETLIKKLGTLTNEMNAKDMRSQAKLYGRIKTKNEKAVDYVSRINSAILNDKKITFYYLTYNLNKELERKHSGQTYVVSPYGMAWNKDKYYIVGVQEKQQADGNIEVIGTKTFRIDRMENVKIKDEKRCALPEATGKEDFDMAKFCERCVSMYSGKEMEIRLRLPNYLMDTAIDQFGGDFWVINKDKQSGTFEMRATVSFSKTFIGWIAGFGGEVELLSPQEAIDEMKLQLSNVLDAHK